MNNAANSPAPSAAVTRDAVLTLLATGEKVRVIGVPDSDHRAPVWVCFVADPDRDAFVMRNELGI